jgi:hypothetical protein
MLVLGDDLRFGIFAISLCGLATLGVTWSLARHCGGPWAAATAGVLLLSSQSYRLASNHIWSEVPSALVTIACAALIVRGGTSRVVLGYALVGVLAGLSILLRFANVGLVVGIVAAVILGPPFRLRRAAPTILVLLPMAGVVLFHNWWFYGHALTTGYHLWGHIVQGDFSARFMTTSEAVRTGPSWPFLRSMLGLGDLYPLPVFLMAVWGVRTVWRDRFRRPELGRLALVCGAITFVQLALYAPWAWHADLYLVPLVPLVVVAAGVGVARMFPGRRCAIPLALAVAWLAWSLWQSPGINDAEFNSISNYRSLQQLSALAETDAVLLTSADPAMAEPAFLVWEREILYLETWHLAPLRDLTLKTLGAAVLRPHRVNAWISQQDEAGRAVYVDQHLPARRGARAQGQLMRAISVEWELVPSDVEGILRVAGRKRTAR